MTDNDNETDAIAAIMQAENLDFCDAVNNLAAKIEKAKLDWWRKNARAARDAAWTEKP